LHSEKGKSQLTHNFIDTTIFWELIYSILIAVTILPIIRKIAFIPEDPNISQGDGPF